VRGLFFAALFSLFAQSVLAKELPDFTDLVEQQGPAVVNVSTSQTLRQTHAIPGLPNLPEGDPLNEFFRRFAPPAPQQQESQSLGSGFIIDAEGYILTNAHVVDSADKITVRLTDKREFKAKLIGFDKRTDVALLKIEASGLPKVVLGKPEQLKVGEWVVAIGSPFGFDSSVTAGIVSAKGRSLPQENYVPFIQTDVAINPGNSGGPLFNMKGEVVGINSQIYSRSGGYMGLSFAIPIDVAMEVVDQLRKNGKVTRGRIGVTIQELTRELAESFGLAKAEGAVISSVEKGGAADKAGLEAGDVVLKFDGKTVISSADLPRMVAMTKPGSKVQIQIWRKNTLRDITLIVAEIKEENVLAQADKNPEEAGHKTVSLTRLGVKVVALSDELKAKLQIKSGLLVEEVKKGSRNGLHAGDIILSVGNLEAQSAEQINTALKSVANGRNVALLIRRGDWVSYLAIKLDE